MEFILSEGLAVSYSRIIVSNKLLQALLLSKPPVLKENRFHIKQPKTRRSLVQYNVRGGIAHDFGAGEHVGGNPAPGV